MTLASSPGWLKLIACAASVDDDDRHVLGDIRTTSTTPGRAGHQGVAAAEHGQRRHRAVEQPLQGGEQGQLAEQAAVR